MNKISLLLSVVLILFLGSCDKEFNEVGLEVIDANKYQLNTYLSPVSVDNVLTGPVEVSNLPLNSLGVYNDPAFGLLNHSFVSQVELVEEAIDLGDNPIIKNVVLSVPYFSTLTSRSSDGEGIYQLDSIYGSSSVKLSVYESGYYMRNFASNLQDVQKYYSDEESKFTSKLIGTRLNNSQDTSENDVFKPSNKEISIKDSDGNVTSRLSPRMFLNLDKAFFQNKILNATSDKLLNNNVFKEYFRGLFFKIESAGLSANEGCFMQLDFSKAQIQITYNVTGDAEEKIFLLNIKGNSANFLNQPKTELQADKIVLKGGDGAIANLKLFTNQELAKLRSNQWLINEANLVFTVDNTMDASANLARRLLVYDADNTKHILDHRTDLSTTIPIKNGKAVYDGKAQKNNSGKITTYRIRITKHINEVLNNTTSNDSINIKLGLAVTEDINSVSFTKNKNQSKQVPLSNVISPFGVILQGNSNVKNNLQLEIFYSTPKQ